MASVIEHEIEDAAKAAAGEAQNTEDKQIVEKDAIPEEVMDEENVEVVGTSGDTAESERLHKMGLSTAIAIGLHNFPEGKYKLSS